MDEVRSRRAFSESNGAAQKTSRAILRALTVATFLVWLAFVPMVTHAQGAQEATQISIGAPAQVSAGDLLTVQAVLVDSSGYPIPKATVFFTTQTEFLHEKGDVVLAQAVTNKDGQAVAQFKDNFSGSITLRAEFRGDAQYASSDATTEVATISEGQVYVDHVGVPIPGLTEPLVNMPMASIQSTSQLMQRLRPLMNGWPITAALIIVWSLYLVIVKSIFRIANSESDEVESTLPADGRRSS